ncbi:hypothetical protein [Pseudonocardia nigra]|uniref:hypothetical protein n=1 Tax=Pseudonocardia nigra TaxID=1921578 RepID=UPI001C5F69D8|nr:hypothetical protein [Pseudonocardia nigra]
MSQPTHRRPNPTVTAVAVAAAVVVVVLTLLVVLDRYPPLPGDALLSAALASATGDAGPAGAGTGAAIWSTITWFGAGPMLSIVGVAAAGVLA